MSKFYDFGKNLPIWLRVIILLLIPTSGLMAFVSFSIADKMAVLEKSQQAQGLVDLTLTVSELVHALQQEAGASATAAATGAAAGGLTPLQQSSQGALENVQARAAVLDIEKLSPELDTVLSQGLAKVDQLVDIRAKIAGSGIAAGDVNSAFTGAIVQLLDFSVYSTKVLEDPEISRAMRIYAYTLQAAEASSAARANAAVGFAAGTFDTALYSKVLDFISGQATFEAIVQLNSTAEQRTFFAQTYTGAPVTETRRMLDVMLQAGPGGDVSSVTAPAWLDVNAQRMALYGQV